MDPHGHSEITKAAVAVLQEAAPDEDFTYFYFGNWLTDVSQVRSPVDAAALLPTVRRELLKEAVQIIRDELAQRPTAPTLPAPLEPGVTFQLADQLAEKTARLVAGDYPVHLNYKNGRLAQYIEAGVFINGYLQFCNLSAGHNLPFEEYCRIFDQRFTQYFPHEHIDRFPRDESKPSKLGRRTYQYIEDDIEYVAELLTAVEIKWARYHVLRANLEYQRLELGDVDPSAVALFEAVEAHQEQVRHDLLVEFGHACHAVEDFFSHSNFVEHCMQLLGVDSRSAAAAIYGFSGNTKAETTRLKTIFHLRLVREVSPNATGIDSEGEPLPPGATIGESRVVTGSYDSIDTSISLHSGMEAFSEKPLVKAILTARPAVSNQGAHTGVSHYDHRPAAPSKAERTRVESAWKQLFEGPGQDVPERVRQARSRIQDIDWELYDIKDNPQLMVSSMIEKVVAEGGERSEERIHESSLDPDSPTWAMRPGTHSLLAKDSPKGNPGYVQAMNLAKRVSTYIAELMTRNFSTTPNPIATSYENDHATIDRNRWIDWAEVLRYFVGHPSEAATFEAPWESRQLLVRLEESTTFELDSDLLSSEAQFVLDGLVQQLEAQQQELMILVEGHACTLGTRKHNQALSERRAEAVAQYMILHGVDSTTIQTEGLGAAVPLASNATEAGRRRNRRVEVYASFPDDEANPRITQWWRECINDPKGVHGHAPRFVSDQEAKRLATLPTRIRLEQAYNTRAPIDEAEYGARRAKDDAHFLRETVTLVHGKTTGRNPHSQRFQQDDVDYGAVRVSCLKGRVRVRGATDVGWFTPTAFVDIIISEGQTWAAAFHAEGAVADQTNIVVLEGLQGTSVCDLEMISYDLRPTGAGDLVRRVFQ